MLLVTVFVMKAMTIRITWFAFSKEIGLVVY